VRSRASDAPDQFTPESHDDISGWLWEGPFAALIRDAIPDVTDADLRRARDYLNASGMVVNVRGSQTDAPPHGRPGAVPAPGRRGSSRTYRDEPPPSPPRRRSPTPP